MKKFILTSLAVLSAATLYTSCNDMLDTDPRVTEMTQATFPGKPADVEALNAATYSIMNTLGGGDQSGILNNPFYWWSLMSDDCYGSGGLQDNVAKSLHHFTTASANQYEQDFILLYGGISRANNQIETIDNVAWTEAQKTQRNQLLGEAYFMRGLYTMWLTQMYGDVPLITSTVITEEMKQQVSAEEVIYPQILSDFTSAKNLMKAEKANGSGHADKFAAEAFIARAWMFWAGFYKKVGELATGDAEMKLVEQEGCTGGTLKKADVVNYLKDIVSTGGYKLCEDFRSLWQYSNSLLWDEAHDGEGHAYTFIADMDRKNCFDQPGMGNGNTEEIFQIQFMNASKWAIGGTYNNPRMYSNYLSCFWGLRNGATNDNGKRDKTYPFNQGWGQGTPSCNIWDDWTDAERSGNYTDCRKLGSLIDLENELESYTYEKDDNEESGYAVKKYADVNLDACAADNDSWWSKCEGYSSSSLDNKQQGDHFEDYYLMRYADVLLMLTELTGDAQYMNQVQARAKVPQTPYSLKAVQDERRWEFALEGLRFNDMRRWSGKDNHSETSYAAKALQAQKGKQIVCLGQKSAKRTHEHMTCSWAKRYKDTQGFLPKPQAQITLLNGKMQQNPGWDENTPAAEWTYKVIY
ncbi:MAG: RagB/SusD family nutrient uptake outer membrane protein [Bacteroidaceae bacterium]|nr:RagB/SusD family nutrient uptake outer membrane protein [Bacteroidaceae bacterium]